MAKIRILSDIHLHGSYLVSAYVGSADHDVVVVAGDIMKRPVDAMTWCRQKFEKPVVFVAGNHEFYRCQIQHEIARARREQPDGVHFLKNSAVVIAGVRFLGCTLWTDYAVDGNPVEGMRQAAAGLNDHRQIEHGRGYFRPEHALSMHQQSVQFLEDQFATSFDGPTVVVTHHAPSPQSIAPEFKGDPTNPAFVSDLEEQISRWQPDLWIHGHVHASFDYDIGRTRVICNPDGYRSSNLNFDHDLVIEVGVPEPTYDDDDVEEAQGWTP